MNVIEEGVSSVVVNGQHENARQLQQKAAYEERLKAIKNKNTDPLFLKNSKNVKAPLDEYVVYRDKNVGAVWVETVNNKKRQDQSKLVPPTPQLEKRQTYSYQKKQVILQESFDTQVKPNAEESDALFLAARLLCNDFDPNRNQDTYHVKSVNDSFPIGDTQIYSVSTLDSNATVRIHRALSQNTSPNSFIPLQCGVYHGDEPNDFHSSSDLRAVAIAFRLNARHCFVALSVRHGNLGVPVDRLLGPRKIAVMSAAGQYNLGDNKRLFDRVINLIPAVPVAEIVHSKLQILTDDVFSPRVDSHYRSTHPPPITVMQDSRNDEPERVATAYDERDNSDDGYGYRPGDTSDEDSQGGQEDAVERSPYYRPQQGGAEISHYPASSVAQGRYFEGGAEYQQSPQRSNTVDVRQGGRSRSHSRDSHSYHSRSRSSSGHSYNSSYYSDGSYNPDGENHREDPPHYGHAEEEDFDPASWKTQYSSSKHDLIKTTLSIDAADEEQVITTNRSNKSAFSNPNSITKNAPDSAKMAFNPRNQPLISPHSRQSPVDTSPMKQCGGATIVDEGFWRLESRSSVAGPVSVVMSLDLTEVVSLHCSSNLLVLEGRDSSTLFTGTLKSASTNTKYMVSGDKIFQWTRGAYMRGWLAKWPTNSQQKLVRPSQRYFVLKDRSLSYYKEEPRDDDNLLGGGTASKFFELGAECSVKVGIHNMQRCIKVRTTTSKLWVAVADGADEEERRWLNEINKAIVTSAEPSTPSQPPVHYSTHWYHESPRMNILSVDATTTSGGFGYMRVALFELCGLTGTPKGRLFSGGKQQVHRPSEGFSARAAEAMHNSYFVEIGTEALEKLKLPVVLTNESPSVPSDLSVVKVFGSDMVILGGSGGFLGVGAVGRTTGVALGRARKVMYCIICRPPAVMKNASSSGNSKASLPASSSYPHSDHSMITTIACGVTATVFAAADSEGTISLWFLDRADEALRLSESPSKTNLAFYYKIKPALQCAVNVSSLRDSNHATLWSDERVLSMQFLCDDRYLAISTSQRLVLLLVANAGNVPSPMATLPYRFAGWVEVDRVLIPDSTGLFGFNVEEQEVFVPGSGSGGNKKVASKITYWRALQSSVEENTSSKIGSQKRVSTVRYTVSKFEWSSAMLISILNQMQPL